MRQSKDTPRATVLLVEDEVTLLRAIERHLERAGYAVDGFTSGKEAIAHVGRGYDVVVTDVAMPDVDGIQLLRSVRQHDRDLPVVLMTGAPSLESATEAIEHGVFKYLQKPVAAGELVEAIGRAARLYRLGKTKREALVALGTSQGEGGDRVSLEASFERALDSLWVAFQPIVRAGDRSLFGYEALVRCGEPGLPRPGAIIDAAERLGQLPRLGRAVRRRVVEATEAAVPSGRLFLNLHPRELTEPGLLDELTSAPGFAERIVLEMTERASLDGIPDLPEKVSELRQAGCSIAIDDLGAGYAGLSSFVLFEPDFVKLDISLVRDVDGSPVKQKLVRSMTSLCREMGLPVVAEGVETAGERDRLIDLGCDLLQGHRFGRPSRSFIEPVW